MKRLLSKGLYSLNSRANLTTAICTIVTNVIFTAKVQLMPTKLLAGLVLPIKFDYFGFNHPE